MILHITSRAAWQAAEQDGEYAASSLKNEGFIHCSTLAQAVPVANAFYRGQQGLVLLVIDEARAKPEIRWEPPAGALVEGISASDLFPHLYGPLNLEAVVRVLDFPPGPTGAFSLPPLD